MRRRGDARRGRLGACLALAAALVLGGCSVPPTADDADSPQVPGSTGTPAAPDGAETGERSSPRASAPRQSRVTPDQPNLVLVMTDDMRADDLRFMPRTRRLIADTGVDMRNAFSQFPLCCPARASFLTGQMAHNHGVMWHGEPFGYGAFDDSSTLATALQDAGYQTGFIGKYLNGYGRMPSKVTGVPSHLYVPSGWTEWRGAIENPGDIEGLYGDTYDYYRTPYNVDGEVRQDWHRRYQTNVVGDFSLDMAGRLSGQDPFFMYVSYVAPHFGLPFESRDIGPVRSDDGAERFIKTPASPPGVWGRFDDRIEHGAGMPADGGPAEADVSDKAWFWANLPEPNAAERIALRDSTRQRAESLLIVDRQVGRLVQRLQRLGEWEDTVMVFTSDNGYFQGEHRQRDGKIKAHEPSLRIPLLITGPGVPRGERRYDPMTVTDLTATFVDLGEAEAPHPADGESRWPSITDGDRGWSTPVVTEARNSQGNAAIAEYVPQGPRLRGFSMGRTSIGIRTARYSYTRYRYGFTELYDLVRDPLQMRNVAGAERYADDERRLSRQWRRLKDCEGDGCLRPLPPALRADADTLSEWGRDYWQAVRRTYG